MIASRVTEWLRASGQTTATDEIRRLISKRGSFHVARVAAYKCRGSDAWHGDQQTLADELADFEQNPEVGRPMSSRVLFELVVNAIKSSPTHTADVDRAWKSSAPGSGH